MQFIKSATLFMMVNFAIMFTIGLIIRILNLEPVLADNKINYQFLLFICLLWGMVGSFISLMLSKVMAKKMMGLQVIDPNTASSNEKHLLNTVYGLCHKAGMKEMPEVSYYESNEINAFATGPSKNSSLVAVSTGLLNKMDQKELEGVLGHEIAHIVNGDMVTMTLIQGAVNAFAMFLAIIIAQILANSGKGGQNRRRNYMAEYMIRMILQSIFTLLGSIIVCWFSRHREFRADAGGAKFAGKQNMVNALLALKDQHAIPNNNNRETSDNMNTFKISDPKKYLVSLFRTHPPLDQRIESLRLNKDIM